MIRVLHIIFAQNAIARAGRITRQLQIALVNVRNGTTHLHAIWPAAIERAVWVMVIMMSARLTTPAAASLTLHCNCTIIFRGLAMRSSARNERALRRPNCFALSLGPEVRFWASSTALPPLPLNLTSSLRTRCAAFRSPALELAPVQPLEPIGSDSDFEPNASPRPIQGFFQSTRPAITRSMPAKSRRASTACIPAARASAITSSACPAPTSRAKPPPGRKRRGNAGKIAR